MGDEELQASISKPLLEEAVSEAMIVGGLMVRASKPQTAVDLLRAMVERARGGDLKYYGLALKHMARFLTNFTSEPNGIFFMPIQFSLVGLEMEEVREPWTPQAREWRVTIRARYEGKEVTIAWRIIYFTTNNMFLVTPDPEWLLNLHGHAPTRRPAELAPAPQPPRPPRRPRVEEIEEEEEEVEEEEEEVEEAEVGPL